MSDSGVRIEAARERDAANILELIRGLAEYEQLSHEVVATEQQLRAALFGPRPAAEVLMAWNGDTAVGFALYFGSFSTFVGKPGIYLEDLFVLPAWRGRRIGAALFAAVARIAVERDCGRMEWSVLDWNEPALDFYRRQGARPLDEWTMQRLTGVALRRAAGLTPP